MRKPKVELTENNSVTWKNNWDSAAITEDVAEVEGIKLKVELGHGNITERQIRGVNVPEHLKDMAPVVGTPITEITWQADGGFDRAPEKALTKEEKKEQGVTLEKREKRAGFAVIKRVRTMLMELMAGKYKAKVPSAIHFSGSLMDPKKNQRYADWIAQIAEEMGWIHYVEGETMTAWDPEYEATEQDLIDADESFRDELPWEDNETDPLVATMGEMFVELEQDRLKNVLIPMIEKFRNNSRTASWTSLRPHTFHEFSSGVFYDNNELYDKLMIAYNETGKIITIMGRHAHYGEYHTVMHIDNSPTLSDGAWQQQMNDVQETFETRLKFKPDMMIQDQMEADSAPMIDVQESAHKFDDPKMEEQAKQAEKGLQDDKWFQKLWDGIKDAMTGVREFKFLKRKEYGDVQYALRQLKKGKAASARRAVKILKDVLSGLNRTQYHNLQRLSYLMDLREQVEINEDLDAKGEDRIVIANPFGWSDKQIKIEAAKVWDLVKKDPKTELAWLYRQEAWFKIRKSYAGAMAAVGFDVANRLQRVHYFRHQVLDYMAGEHKRTHVQGSGRLAIPTSRSHLKHRGAQTGYAMNLNFLQAEFEIMTQLLYDTQVAITLEEIMETHGSKEYKEGYELYKPREGAVFYTANTIPAKLLEDALATGAKAINVPRTQIKQALALGGKYKGYYLPEKIANTLNEALIRKPVATWAKVLLKSPMRMWKAWQLISPFRILKYNVRNMTGDAEAVFLGSPGVFKWAPKAVGDLWRWKTKGNISKDMQDWIDRGGQEATLQAQEFYEILERPEFKTMMTTEGKIKQLLTTTARLPRAATDFREMILRYAAYLKFKNELDKNNGKPKDYVASLKEEVDVLKDNGDKAFMMSNDMLGAYDRVSQLGEGLRTYIAPFWSFQEVNMKRTVTMFNNAINNDKAASFVGRKLGAVGVVSAIKVGKLFMKLFAFSVVVGLWNNTVMSDAEDGLPEEMRERSHVILWQTEGKKPQIYYFPRIGVVGDLLEWAGMDTLPSNIVDLILGKRSFKDIVDSYDMGVRNAKDITNKVIQVLGPQYKIPIEGILGDKLFPSVWNRQPITDHGKWLADNFQLGAFYDKATGRPQRHDWLKRQTSTTAIYHDDKKRLGWLAIQQKLADYKRRAGLKGRGFIITDSGQALYNMGLAWRYGDMNAYTKYLAEYVKVTVDKYGEVDIVNRMENQWEKLNPLEGLPEIHQKLFFASLDERDKKALGLALQYYLEIKGGLQFIEEGGNQ
jgi:hypothetical protein